MEYQTPSEIIESLRPMHHPELTYNCKMNKYGLQIDVHSVPEEVFDNLPYERDEVKDKAVWKKCIVPGITITYFLG